MPRNKKPAFIGPRLENRQVARKKPRVKTPKIRNLALPKSKKVIDARMRKELDRTFSRYKVPKHLFAENSTKTSTKLLKAQTKWLAKNPYMVKAFVQRERLAWMDRSPANVRKSRILENGFSYYSLTQVLVTYGKNCHICNQPIDLKASRRVGVGDWLLGLHIDHLIPIAKGGPDTLENVRPSHAICNLKKGTN